jgi:hypothetical protein
MCGFLPQQFELCLDSYRFNILLGPMGQLLCFGECPNFSCNASGLALSIPKELFHTLFSRLGAANANRGLWCVGIN